MENIIDIKSSDLNYQLTNKLICKIVNPDHSGVVPAAIYASQNQEIPELINKLNVSIINEGEHDLILEPWPLFRSDDGSEIMRLENLSYIKMDFSDFISEDLQGLSKINVDIDEISFDAVRISKSAEKLGIYSPLESSEKSESSVWILKVAHETDEDRIAKWKLIKKEKWTEISTLWNQTRSDEIGDEMKEELIDQIRVLQEEIDELDAKNSYDVSNFVFEPGNQIDVEITSLVTNVRPSLRYFDVSWKNPGLNGRWVLTQNTIVIKRPSYFVEPPFPLMLSWLNNHNEAYISQQTENGEFEIKNELSFAICNKGLTPLLLDCRDEVLEGPYFELVLLGGNHTASLTKTKYLKDVQLQIKNDTYGDKWTHHKMIQGPVVTWRIQPKLYVEGQRNRRILGVEDTSTISFTIKNLKVFADEGVSMVYLKYYNIPDFDDDQVVLLVEKKNPAGSIPSAGIEQKYLTVTGEKQAVTPPLRWEMNKEEDGAIKTTVLLGHSVGIGVEETEGALTVSGTATINGATKINGKLDVSAEIKAEKLDAKALLITEVQADKLEANTIKSTGVHIKANRAKLRIQDADGLNNSYIYPWAAGVNIYKEGNSSHPTYFGRDGDGSDFVFYSGNVGVGVNDPVEKLDVRGKIRISTGSDWDNMKIWTDGDTSYIEANGANQGLKITAKDESNRRTNIYLDARQIMPIEPNMNIGSSGLRIGDIYCENLHSRNLPFPFSDRSLKSDILPLTSQLNSSEIIKKLTPVIFKWRVTPETKDFLNEDDLNKTQIGFIANEVSDIVPNAVHRVESNGKLALNHQFLNTILFDAVKKMQVTLIENSALIKVLQAEIETLKKDAD